MSVPNEIEILRHLADARSIADYIRGACDDAANAISENDATGARNILMNKSTRARNPTGVTIPARAEHLKKEIDAALAAIAKDPEVDAAMDLIRKFSKVPLNKLQAAVANFTNEEARTIFPPIFNIANNLDNGTRKFFVVAP